MDIAMWTKAVRVIPRVDKEEWDRLDVVSRWLIATRSAVLVMTLMSAGLAGLLALRDGKFSFLLWALLTVGLAFAHATNNLVNDLTDHWKGVDRDNYFRAQYGPQPLEHGLLSVKAALKYTAVTGAVALAAGLALTYWRGEPVLMLLAVGAFFVLFYTWPLKFVGLGEPAVVVVWGPLMVGGGYYVITGEIRESVFWASLPLALGATTVLFGKHIDKLEADRAKGIRTLPVLLGEGGARLVAIGLLVAMYVVTVGLVLSGAFGWPLLLVTGALPWARLALLVYAHARPSQPPPEYPDGVWPLWYSAFAFRHMRRFGALFLLGMMIETALRRIS